MGARDSVKGRAKQTVGRITGNTRLRTEGRVDRAVGSVKDAVDKVGKKVVEIGRRVERLRRQ